MATLAVAVLLGAAALAVTQQDRCHRVNPPGETAVIHAGHFIDYGCLYQISR